MLALGFNQYAKNAGNVQAELCGSLKQIAECFQISIQVILVIIG